MDKLTETIVKKLRGKLPIYFSVCVECGCYYHAVIKTIINDDGDVVYGDPESGCVFKVKYCPNCGKKV